MKREEREVAIKDLLDCASKYLTIQSITEVDIVDILSSVLYSIGHSISNCTKDLTSYEVMQMYTDNPSLGTALMAQAMYMKETWERKVDNDRKDI